MEVGTRRKGTWIADAVLGVAMAIAVVACDGGEPLVVESRATVPTSPSPVTPPPVTPLPDVRSLVGIPPRGQRLSTPAVGRLFMSIEASTPDGIPVTSYVYVDGRVIWQQRDPGSAGLQLQDDWQEVRLTHGGAYYLYSEVLASGLFEHDLQLDAGPYASLAVRIRNGYGGAGMVSVVTASGPSRDEHLPRETAQQADALRRVESLLLDPLGWVPAGGTADPEVRPYVPSRYVVEVRSWSDNGTPRPAALPDPVDDLARHADVLRDTVYCRIMTIEQARSLVDRLDGPRFTELEAGSLEYQVEFDFPVYVSIDPALPDVTSC